MKKKIKINFTDFWHPNTQEAIRNNPLFMLLSKRFDLELSDNPDFIIYSCFDVNFLRYKCVRIFYTGENIRPNFNECDYAFSFDYPITDKNYRLPLYKLYKEFEELKKKKDINEIKKVKKDFCSFVYTKKKAKERIKFFHKLQKYKNIDSGGKLLNNIGYRIDNKVEFLRKYKFTIAFENSSYPGYTTEKLMQAFVANTVPIYWGNPLVSRDFNPESFINCQDYKNFDEVVERVIEVDNNDELYIKYLMESPFQNNNENEYVKEENILRRFEEIFSNKNITLAAKKSNLSKPYTHPIYIKNKCRKIYHLFRAMFSD
ncbi:glycosyltransferase family 10 domain-containing protein [Planctomycetota bacterium]